MTCWRVDICHSFAIEPLLANLMTYWRWVSVRPSSWSQLPWILDDILKVGLRHRTSYSGYPDDILKVTAHHLTSYSGQYWWRGWLPHKGGGRLRPTDSSTSSPHTATIEDDASTSGRSQIDTYGMFFRLVHGRNGKTSA